MHKWLIVARPCIHPYCPNHSLDIVYCVLIYYMSMSDIGEVKNAKQKPGTALDSFLLVD